MRFCYTKKFCRDYARAGRRGKDTGKLDEIMDCLIHDKQLPPRCSDHELVGNFKGVRACHVTPDWLLLYTRSAEGVVFIATGTHADLFR
ncbi:type II toxin-antitoxin system RelE/ParE family toxin [Desulfolutivibrio sulfoxidireducens]|uniref:type II toxin-antitoxin system RelE/ParE family toxin n=1 Tax=Desulfolutivibrio sulfoxidireducens TaxID=2773299 RepID=UPI00159E3F87|nr:type II toxin-antitoxin system YafQ family toxin [Desulfolutivibrio sulfoxidireducens]QLA17630.1 type II toxin-antitoxin system mRNA interferase toxin, RelE/StbE family [Desulfolutivibrio sulfoxidireducens]